MKWLGGSLIMAGCVCYHSLLTGQERVQEESLRDLIRILTWMENELQGRLWPLGDLFRRVGDRGTGLLARIFLEIGDMLKNNVVTDASACVEQVLRRYIRLPENSAGFVRELGRSLGGFELQGQLCEIERIREEAEGELEMLLQGKQARQRTRRVLSLSTGAILILLLI